MREDPDFFEYNDLFEFWEQAGDLAQRHPLAHLNVVRTELYHSLDAAWERLVEADKVPVSMISPHWSTNDQG